MSAEQRRAEIREWYEAAKARTHWDGDVYGPRYCQDVPRLLAEVERLADENQGLRLGAIQDEGLWSSQDAGLRAEVERLTAERDAANNLPVGTEIRRLPSGRWSVDIPDCCVYEARETLTEAIAAVSGAEKGPGVSPNRTCLEYGVVEAALAERRADLSRHPGSDYVPHYPLEALWREAHSAYGAAVDALLAFMGEGSDA